MGCLVLTLRAIGRIDEAWVQLAACLKDALEIRSYRGVLMAITGSALLELDRGNVAHAIALYSTGGMQPLVSLSAWFADVAGKEIAAAANQLSVGIAANARRNGETGRSLGDRSIAG